MAISMVEFQGQIPRQQDFQAIKQNEDSKPMVDYGNFQNQVERKAESASSQVIQRKEAELAEDRGQGKGSYQGDGGRKRRTKEDKVVKKTTTDSFDIRI